ncbi:hypothetical protein Tco_0714949 [Tanacetum coccineum]
MPCFPNSFGGFLHLASSMQLVVVVHVYALGPELVLGFALVESGLSQLDLQSAPLVDTSFLFDPPTPLPLDPLAPPDPPALLPIDPLAPPLDPTSPSLPPLPLDPIVHPLVLLAPSSLTGPL